jgi:hypothetical protein
MLDEMLCHVADTNRYIPIISKSANKRLLDYILAYFCTYDKRKGLNYETSLEDAARWDGKKLS